MKPTNFKISEHNTQKAIVHLLHLHGAVVIGADVMDGLKFFTKIDNSRFQFIKYHKRDRLYEREHDLIFILSGCVFFVEIKIATGHQSLEQKEIRRSVTDISYLAIRG